MERFGGEQKDARKIVESLAQKALSAKELSVLTPQERTEIVSETAVDALDILRESGAIEFESVSQMYQSLKGERLLVRREDPRSLFGSIAHRSKIDIKFPEGERYSNAVEWSPTLDARGLQNAYLEGYGQLNSVVAIVGFRGEELDVRSLPDSEQVFAGLDRTYVRSISGTVRFEDIVFVTLRIPSLAFPEEKMTDAEYEQHHDYLERRSRGDIRNPTFIHRGFLFTDHVQKH